MELNIFIIIILGIAMAIIENSEKQKKLLKNKERG